MQNLFGQRHSKGGVKQKQLRVKKKYIRSSPREKKNN